MSETDDNSTRSVNPQSTAAAAQPKEEKKVAANDTVAAGSDQNNTNQGESQTASASNAAKTIEKPVATTAAKPASRPAAKTSATVANKTVDGGETLDEQAAKVFAARKKVEDAIKEAERAEEDARLAVERAAAAKAAAEAAEEAEYKSIAAQIKSDATKKDMHTYKRQSEEIFRRDMGEPEFFLEKNKRFQRPILTPQQQESLTRYAETPHDQTPQYVPQRVLSPEFEGVSNYERGVDSYMQELYTKLRTLQKDPNTGSSTEISNIKSKISYLESLHENYYIGMNVFRTAKGGRSKINAK